MKSGVLRSQAATEEDSVYRLYYDFSQALPKLQGHQILAINRGEKEEKLEGQRGAGPGTGPARPCAAAW